VVVGKGEIVTGDAHHLLDEPIHGVFEIVLSYLGDDLVRRRANRRFTGETAIIKAIFD